MDFARKQLEKYGWSDGKGLGKNENGISEALKPKLKRSMTGVGHNAASDFTEHWWSTLYDKAANNIQVKEKDGTTKKIKTKYDSDFEITNSTWKLKRKKLKSSDLKPQEQYKDFFVRTAVLGSGGSRTERIRELESESEDDQVQKDVFKMTDEELFAACEGRTAHKGARHGLKALGKLARIEQQEKMLLQQSRFNGYSHAKRCTKNIEYEQVIIDAASLNCNEDTTVLKKKKKKKHCLKKEDYETLSKTHDAHLNNSTTKKQKKKPTDCDVSETFDDGNTDFRDLGGDQTLPRKVKKKKLNTIDEELNGGNTEMMEVGLQNEVLSSVKKRKKRKHLDEFDSENCDTVGITCKLKSGEKNKKAVCT